jgi:hypothetical protein
MSGRGRRCLRREMWLVMLEESLGRWHLSTSVRCVSPFPLLSLFSSFHRLKPFGRFPSPSRLTLLCAQVPVHRRPTIAVLSTGNELRDLQSTSTSSNPSSNFAGIVDSNRPTLISVLSALHFPVIDLGICGDTMEATKAALKKGAEQADLVITTGGTSMGVGDLLKPCIERELGGTVHFGRVAMKPGYVVPSFSYCFSPSLSRSSSLFSPSLTPSSVSSLQKTYNLRYTPRSPLRSVARSDPRLRSSRQPCIRSCHFLHFRCVFPPLRLSL